MLTETLARSLTIEELATRLESHDDIAVRIFAQRSIERIECYEQLMIDAGVEYDD
jgi:RNA-binding protein YhbY